MNNTNLIESLEYHVSILEKESRGKKAAKAIGAGAGVGGAVGFHRSLAKENPFRKTTSIEKEIMKDRPGKGWKELAKHDISKMYKKAGKAGLKGAAIGAGVVGAGIATKKAYDHFKNKKK